MADPTECTNPITCIVSGVGDSINSAASTIGYWSDPWGNTFKALQDAAKGMATDVMPVLTKATLPDLTADWFIQAYKISFATAILGAVLLLIPQLVRTARGAMSGRDLADSIGLYFPMFLVGAIFGPAFGIVLVNFFHSLSDVFASWGITGSVDNTVAAFDKMIAEADPGGIAGGIPIAVLLMLFMVVGLFMVLCVLVIQLVTLYFTGVLVPLALVWIIDPTRRQFGMRLVGIWVGILAAHPLLFFLLGFAFTMMSGSVSTFGSNTNVQNTVQLLVSIISIFIAAFSPLVLMKFAPVLPIGAGGSSGPSVRPGSWGPNNMTEATSRYQPRSTSSSQADASTSGRDYPSPEYAGNAGSSGGGLGEAAASRQATASSGRLIGAESASASASGAAATAGAEAGGATVAAEGLAATGAAESATGAGAVIGIPTLVAAGAVMAAKKTSDLTQAAGNHATNAMGETENNQ